MAVTTGQNGSPHSRIATLQTLQHVLPVTHGEDLHGAIHVAACVSLRRSSNGGSRPHCRVCAHIIAEAQPRIVLVLYAVGWHY